MVGQKRPKRFLPFPVVLPDQVISGRIITDKVDQA
jgi:hypothetical protein